MSIAAVVLAAGAGSRFAGPGHKLAAVIDGQPIVRRAVIAALGAGLDEVLVVQGAIELGELLEGLDVTLLTNELWAGGQSTSLRRAVDHATAHGHETIVVGLGDQPFIPSSAWCAVAQADGPIVTALFGSGSGARRRPPVKLDASVWDLLPVTGDHGARMLIANRPDLVHEVACEGNPADVDDEEDLRRWN